ncbi:MAG: UbiA-like protein EboC [Bacteroidota bacterium]
MRNRFLYFIQIIRPANVVTAVADVIAGAAIAGFFSAGLDLDWSSLLFLVISTMGLYAGGIVFNDVFDYELDKVERPERILPSGKLSKKTAIIFGLTLLGFAVIAAFLVGWGSGLIAFGIALLALLYDKYGKHHPVFGPLNMGLCRAFNLLLGVSIIPAALPQFWWIGIIPILFIGAVTLTSQKENTGDNQSAIKIALGLDVLIMLILITLGFIGLLNLSIALVFLILWFVVNLRAKRKAIRFNNPANIQNAVKMGILSLIPLDASLAAGFSGNILLGIVVLSLLGLSIGLAKLFAVT